MKKLGIILVVVLFTVILMSSCRSTKSTCPAYGQKASIENSIKS